ncbi:MAG TPA: hypothetical protein DCY25_00775 [Bacteroidales bacterium]|nr:hypothetical protein [Bacteroidales bacterium]
MSRQVISSADIRRINQIQSENKNTGQAVSQATRDTYSDRLFKYIPAEIVAGYIFAAGMLENLTKAGEISLFQWGLFLIFLILTPLYLWRVQKVQKISQHIISALSFVVWVFALGGPFSLLSWYNPVYGAVLLPVFTLAVAIVEAD